jgi:putative transposase
MVYLFVHVIWSVRRREPLLSKPVRRVLFAHLQKEGEEKGIRIVAIGGVEDHVHCLLQLLPSQNLLQVLRNIRTSAAAWINDSKFLTVSNDFEFEWDEEYWAASVSPSGVKQVVEYIGKQEEHHKTKTLESELEIFDKFKESL